MKMMTASGQLLDLLALKTDDIRAQDLGRALAMTCRFGGHVREFYSVAQHSVHVAQLLPPSLQLHGLLHDAAEAYIGDLITPVKEHMPGFKELQARIEYVIFEAFGLRPTEQERDAVKRADLIMLAVEHRDLRIQSSRSLPDAPPGTHLVPWPWELAEARFLQNLARLHPSYIDTVAYIAQNTPAPI
jgi:hypothetical protein